MRYVPNWNYHPLEQWILLRHYYYYSLSLHCRCLSQFITYVTTGDLMSLYYIDLHLIYSIYLINTCKCKCRLTTLVWVPLSSIYKTRTVLKQTTKTLLSWDSWYFGVVLTRVIVDRKLQRKLIFVSTSEISSVLRLQCSMQSLA